MTTTGCGGGAGFWATAPREPSLLSPRSPFPSTTRTGPKRTRLNRLTVGIAQPRSISEMSDVTQILSAIEQGDAKAADKLLPLVYEELRKLAAHRMAKEAAGQTLQATALVHEAWMRLVGKENPKFANRSHFFAAAAEAMRRILIDNARRKRAVRHGGGQQRVDFDQAELATIKDDDQLLAVDEALNKLAVQSKSEAELV